MGLADAINRRRAQPGRQSEAGQLIGRDAGLGQRANAGLDNAVNPRIVADNPIPLNH